MVEIRFSAKHGFFITLDDRRNPTDVGFENGWSDFTATGGMTVPTGSGDPDGEASGCNDREGSTSASVPQFVRA